MRGPSDDVVEAQQQPAGAEAAGPGAEVELAPVAVERPRVPGGKALVRLLQMLESAGFQEVAGEAVQTAVNDEGREVFRDQADRFTAAPDREGAAATPRRPSRARGRRSASKTGVAPEAEVRYESGSPSAEGVATAYLEVGERLAAPTAAGPQWRSLGPWTIPNGQTYGASRVNVSGRISAVVVDPANPAHVLVGAAGGGVWESRDRGGSWAPRTDDAATLTVGALAFDPVNPAIVYCGTGEGNAFWVFGAGILRSSDGGTTWTTLCTTPFVGQGFFALLVDRGDPRHLLAGTTNGLYVSGDGGVNWDRRRTASTWSISMAPAGGAAAEILAACSDGVWRSTDGGATWSSVALPGRPASFKRVAVAISPSNPAVAYAWGAGPPNVGSPTPVPTAYLWRRAGGAWTSQAPPPGVSTGQAWYDWFLAVAPDRDGQVYCGAIEVHRGDLSGTTWTWRNLTNKGTSGDSIHPDQHAIAFEPGRPDTLYVGNDGGLFLSPDRGITWQHRNNGLVISEFEYLAQDHGSSRWLIGGTQDNGTARWTGSAAWDHVADGDGGDCAVNRTNPATVFHTYYGMSPERSTTRGNFGSWTRLRPPIPEGEGSLFYPPFESSATAGDTIAIGGDALYVSRDNGATWMRLAFPASERSSAMFIPNANSVYVGTRDGRIFRTQWTGATWAALAALTTPRTAAMVSDLFVDPANPRRMWATYRKVGGGRVFRSDDAGATWTDRSAGLPGLPVNALEVDPANADRVWVAADLGVYQSTDAGATWSNFSNGLPNALVGDLVFHPHARVLRAGTRNRGVWEIPVDGWMTEPSCAVQWTGTLAPNETRRWFSQGWPATWHILWTVMPTTPRPGAPQVSWTVQVERADAERVTYWITVRNLSPATITFEGRYCLLSRY
ncbi:MAG TPA: hypothetical protein VHG28_14585 [Longimicrobiaceae bacterium]|nr:hypothetical protein [Longimicrobiaceae bacterium]